jgi:hypothetical protein
MIKMKNLRLSYNGINIYGLVLKMALDWDTAYNELLEELGREPDTEEVIERMYKNAVKDYDIDLLF